MSTSPSKVPHSINEMSEKEKTPQVDAEKLPAEDATRVNSAQTSSGAVVESNPETIGLVEEEGKYYLTGKRLWLVHTGVLLSVFLVALDQSIVSTALPKLSSEFHALEQLTWVVSTYFLTQAGLMLFFGQVLTIVSSKWIFTLCIIIFEIGSLICGLAPNMNVLIFGRAIQGVGGSGGFISILTIISQIAALEVRPILLASFGGVFGVASVIGPLLGGVFTDRLTWRWCFYINLPFGAISLLAVSVFLPTHPPLENANNEGKTLLRKWISLDWVGTTLSLGMTVSLLLALQWGGVEKPWNNRVIIALFVLAGVLFIHLVLWERRLGDRAMVPLSILKRRTQLGAAFATFSIMLVGILETYYLPFYYESLNNSAEQSGINIIPFMMAMVIGSGLGGGLNSATGRYTPYMIAGAALYAIAGGLLFTIDEHTPNAKLIGFQILSGFGLGISFNQPMVAIQAEYAYEPQLIPQASSLVTYMQLLGAVCGISIAGAVFGNQLSQNLAAYSSIIPEEAIDGVKQSVTVIFLLPPFLQSIVVTAYVKAIDYAFIIAVPAAGVTIISALFIKNWNLKQRGLNPGAAVA